VPRPERFARALSSVARGVSKLQTAEICCGGLTPEQFETLKAIVAMGDPSMSGLSATLRVDLSTMSRNVSVLEREGYVSRARRHDDSRIVMVILTRKGTTALETLQCDEKDVIARLYQRIPSASRSSVVEALELVLIALAPSDEEQVACCPDPQPRKATR
jgi:DNA-binding MarR family transcriptional regulator